MPRPLRVLYVYTARKRELLANVQRGTAPDTLLFGLNHLLPVARHGPADIVADFYEPAYGPLGRSVARQVGRLGPDVLQLRTLPLFTRYDVVFLTGGWPLLLAAQAIPRHRRPKLVWLNMTLTNLMRRRGALAAGLSTAVRLADRVVCVASFQRTILQERLGLREAQLPLVLSGTDATFYEPSRAASVGDPANSAISPSEIDLPQSAGVEGRQIVLAAGRDAGRDYATLFQAVAAAPFEAQVVCSPPNVRWLALPPNVQVSYDIPPAALRRDYARANAVAIPTQGDDSVAGSDCSGTLVALDALAMGRPVVITERASVHEYVQPGHHVRTVPPGDPAALRRELEAVLGDPAQAAAMATAGRERVLESLTTAHFAARLAEVFREVAS